MKTFKEYTLPKVHKERVIKQEMLKMITIANYLRPIKPNLNPKNNNSINNIPTPLIGLLKNQFVNVVIPKKL